MKSKVKGKGIEYLNNRLIGYGLDKEIGKAINKAIKQREKEMFEKIEIEIDDLLDIIEEWWRKDLIETRNVLVLKRRLRKLKKVLEGEG